MTDEHATIDIPVDALHQSLFDWFDTHHRPFPWRTSDDPWAILVLEVMSQQTQLERVTQAWEAFIDRWPTPVDLAEESPAEVISFWSEHRLGYNRRASFLHDAATQLVEEFDGEVPPSVDDLERLKGVGPYTANAVASFAFDRGGPVVDTNVKRVLYRLLDIPDEDDAYAEALASLTNEESITSWNEAIMELGGIACTKQPACDTAACPFRRWCHAYRTGDFTAPDVPTQPPYEGSRRQLRGRVLQLLDREEIVHIDELGHRLRVDYTPEGTHGRDWLHSLLEDMAVDGLITLTEDSPAHVSLRR